MQRAIILCIVASLLIGRAALIAAVEKTGTADAPAACPLKQKEIDGLLEQTPSEPKTSL